MKLAKLRIVMVIVTLSIMVIAGAQPSMVLAQTSSLYQRPQGSYAQLRGPNGPRPVYVTSQAPSSPQSALPSQGQQPRTSEGNAAIPNGSGSMQSDLGAPERLPAPNQPLPGRTGPQAIPQGAPWNNAPPNFPNAAFLNGDQSAPGTLQTASWMYTPPSAARVLRLHDIISIRVDELAQTTAQGDANSRKNSLYDAVLQEWVQLSSLSLKPAEQNDGDPRATGLVNEVYRANSTLRTRESVTFNIAAEISDIRPNGNIVLTAQKSIVLNDNEFEVSLSGICRPDDIGPDNIVLSKDILDLQIAKNERGQVRDGYSRGWLTKFFYRIKPF